MPRVNWRTLRTSRAVWLNLAGSDLKRIVGGDGVELGTTAFLGCILRSRAVDSTHYILDSLEIF